MPKPTNSRSMMAVESIQKLTPTVAITYVQDDKEVVLVTEGKKVALTKDEIENLFQDTSSKEECSNECLQVYFWALQEEPSSL